MVSEAAVLAGVSRQYIHQIMDEFDPHSVSGYIVLRKDLVLDWRKRREEAETERAEQEKRADPSTFKHPEQGLLNSLAKFGASKELIELVSAKKAKSKS